jgi:hypothetical protein
MFLMFGFGSLFPWVLVGWGLALSPIVTLGNLLICPDSDKASWSPSGCQYAPTQLTRDHRRFRLSITAITNTNTILLSLVQSKRDAPFEAATRPKRTRPDRTGLNELDVEMRSELNEPPGRIRKTCGLQSIKLPKKRTPKNGP